MAQYTDIFVDQGSNLSLQIPVLNPDGLPKNLSGFVARGQVRRSYTSTSSLDFSCEVSDDPEAGIVTVSLTPDQTRLMKAGRYVFDVEISTDDSPETTVLRIAEGQVHVNPRVTQLSRLDVE